VTHKDIVRGLKGSYGDHQLAMDYRSPITARTNVSQEIAVLIIWFYLTYQTTWHRKSQDHDLNINHCENLGLQYLTTICELIV
jgi:hypothetical protein